MSEKIVSAGSGKHNASTRSNVASPATASSRASTRARISGVIACTRAAVNARVAGRRSRVCSGWSRLTIDGCGNTVQAGAGNARIEIVDDGFEIVR